MSNKTNDFPPEIVRRLKTYVYRLIDPRNGETFYVGKGKGNRVFAHIYAETSIPESDEDAGELKSNKLKRIREIRNAGFEVGHVIHRHGMNDETAREVEAALMEAYAGLTNIAGAYGSSADRGVMHAQEIIRNWSAKPAVFAVTDRILLINVNKSAADRGLYEATRYAWKINPKKARQAQVILAVTQGLIIGAFIADDWLEANEENAMKYFSGHDPAFGRHGFVGKEAPAELKNRYVGKRIPDEYRKKGAANPIKYTW